MRNAELAFPKFKYSRTTGQLVELVGDQDNQLKKKQKKKSMVDIYETGHEFLEPGAPNRFMHKWFRDRF